MSRSTDEWIGKNDDTPIPARVKDRVATRAGMRCQKCTRQTVGKLRAEFDHAIPLIVGGANRENNIQLLCHECHGAKTVRDVKLKAKLSRVRKIHLGIKKPSKFACSRSSKFKKKISGEVVAR